MIDRLIYLVSDPTGSHNVGAFIKGAGGEHFTATVIGAKTTLDVNVVGDADDGIFAEDDVAANLHKGQSILAVRRDTLAIDTSATGNYGDFKTNDRGALWVAPVGNVADGVSDLENPVKVGSKTDSVLTAVADANRADLISDLFRRLRVNDSADIGVLQSQDDISNVAEVLLGTALAGRKHLLVQNRATNKDLFVGAAGVTAADGYEIRRGSSYGFPIGPNVALYGIGSDATNMDIRQLELA